MARMQSEDERMGGPLTIGRTPTGPKRSGDKGTIGDQAVMDAVLIVGGAWLIMFLLMFSLRRHNV